jgi:hypothetical protein
MNRPLEVGLSAQDWSAFYANTISVFGQQASISLVSKSQKITSSEFDAWLDQTRVA